MNKLPRALAAALLGASVFAIVGPASAAPTKKDEDYGYIFSDDLVNAPLVGANGGNIIVRPSPARVRLMRPRVQFVSEMLKSVENM
jgi:hypothetical protein